MHCSYSIRRQLPGGSSPQCLYHSECKRHIEDVLPAAWSYTGPHQSVHGSLGLRKVFRAKQVVCLQVSAAASAATDATSQTDSGAESRSGYCLALACPHALYPGMQYTVLFCLFAFSDCVRYLCFPHGSHAKGRKQPQSGVCSLHQPPHREVYPLKICLHHVSLG